MIEFVKITNGIIFVEIVKSPCKREDCPFKTYTPILKKVDNFKLDTYKETPVLFCVNCKDYWKSKIHSNFCLNTCILSVRPVIERPCFVCAFELVKILRREYKNPSLPLTSLYDNKGYVLEEIRNNRRKNRRKRRKTWSLLSQVEKKINKI